VRVVDEHLKTRKARYPWEQDCIELRIDARGGPERSAGDDLRENQNILLVLISPATPERPSEVLGPEAIPEGVEYSCRACDGGFAAEFAVPVPWLNRMQGTDWQVFRLNVAVDDLDGDGTRSQMWWKPDWRTKATYPGSGTFIKADGAAITTEPRGRSIPPAAPQTTKGVSSQWPFGKWQDPRNASSCPGPRA
jgi:hypothetical protein